MLNTLFINTRTKLLLVFAAIMILGAIFYIVPLDTSKNVSGSPLATETRVSENEQEAVFTIIAFGDSLTAGYGVSLEESYPSILEKILVQKNKTIKVINMGVSGETTTGSLDRTDFVISQKPSLVLLETGANDMLRSSSPTIAKENIQTMLKKFKEQDITVVLLGMKSISSNGTEYRNEFDALYSSLAKEYSIPLVPFFLDGVALEPALNTNDGIHPNKDGYEKIVNKNILPILLPLLTGKGLF